MVKRARVSRSEGRETFGCSLAFGASRPAGQNHMTPLWCHLPVWCGGARCVSAAWSGKAGSASHPAQPTQTTLSPNTPRCASERTSECASGRREHEIAVTADGSRRLRRGAAGFGRPFAATRPTRPTRPTNLTSERADERAVESRGRIERAEVWERACSDVQIRVPGRHGSRGAVAWPHGVRLIMRQQWDEQRSAHRRDMVMC